MRLVAALALLAACGPPALPSPDSCSDPASTVDSFAIGPGGDPAAFSPWSDGDSADVAFGGQGCPMLVMRIAVTGADAPACLAQDTSVRDERGASLGHDGKPRQTYAAPDGSRVTRDMYILLEPVERTTIEVQTIVGGTTLTRYLGALPRDLSVPLDGASDLGAVD